MWQTIFHFLLILFRLFSSDISRLPAIIHTDSNQVTFSMHLAVLAKKQFKKSEDSHLMSDFFLLTQPLKIRAYHGISKIHIDISHLKRNLYLVMKMILQHYF